MWDLKVTAFAVSSLLVLVYIASLNVRINSLDKELAVKQSTIDTLRLNTANLQDALDKQNKAIEDQVLLIAEMDNETIVLKEAINTISENAKCDVDRVLKTKPEIGKEIQHMREVAKRLR